MPADQDPLGAGAQLVSRTAPGVEIWQRPLVSRTGNDVAVMLLSASDEPADMHVSWDELNLQAGARARDLWTHRDLSASDGYNARTPPHSAVLLKVHGVRSWRRSVRFEAETPSNARLGNAILFPCGECSSGYAIQHGGEGRAGGVRFEHIHADRAGSYQLEILYVRNGLEDKMISLSVNREQPAQVRAIMRSWNVITIPVNLRAGDNTLTITYQGQLGFDLDCISLSQSSFAAER